jgi:TonB family protein
MVSDLLALVLKTTIVMSVMVLIVLTLRMAGRRYLGAVATYWLWASIPVVMLAYLLPPWLPLRDAMFSTTTLAAVQTIAAAAQPRFPQSHLLDLVAMLWLAGAIGVAIFQTLQQYRFVHSLGVLRAIAPGIYRSGAANSSPSLVGAWAPRIVVPTDFEQRYTPLQQELIVLHEQIHLQRGDAWVNVLLAVLRCLYWFNPLLHFAIHRLRNDQELACDALVLQQKPDARRPYAEAMLNTQLAVTGLPVGCQWQSSHLLEERIKMLTMHAPSRLRRRFGIALIVAMIGTTATLAWATQSSTGTRVHTAGDREATAIRTKPPKYPGEAMRARISGHVTLRVVVDRFGSPNQIDIVESEPAGVFDAAVLDAAANWAFAPKIENGFSVASSILVPTTFKIDDEAKTQMP